MRPGPLGFGSRYSGSCIDAPQIGQQFSGEFASERVGNSCWPDGTQRGGGLVGAEAGLDPAGHQLAQEPVQAVEESGAFVAAVCATFGQQAQNGALVFGGDWAQILLPECSDGNSECIGRIPFAATSDGRDSDLDGQSRWGQKVNATTALPRSVLASLQSGPCTIYRAGPAKTAATWKTSN
jgi:hypothetical protein